MMLRSYDNYLKSPNICFLFTEFHGKWQFLKILFSPYLSWEKFGR